MLIEDRIADVVVHSRLGAGIGFNGRPFGLVAPHGTDRRAVQVVGEHGRTLGIAKRFRGAAKSAVMGGWSRSRRRRLAVKGLARFQLIVGGWFRSQTVKGSLNVDKVCARLLLLLLPIVNSQRSKKRKRKRNENKKE